MSPPDVLVVGGGIVGLSTAWHLVKGGARVLLLDAGEAGRATDAGAGILATADAIDHPDPVQRFVARAARHYPALIEELAAEDAGPTGYKVAGRLSEKVLLIRPGRVDAVLDELRKMGHTPQVVARPGERPA